MPPTTRKTAVKKAPAKQAVAKKAAPVKAAAKKAVSTAKKATPAKKTVAKKATPVAPTASAGTPAQTATTNTAKLEESRKAADPKAVRGPDAETTITFERVFPKDVPHDEWVEAGRRAARDALSSPVITDLEISNKAKGRLVKARFTRSRGLPKTPR